MESERDGRGDVRCLRKWGEIRARLFIAAEQALGRDGQNAVRAGLDGEIALVEVDHDEPIALVGLGSLDQRNPFLKKGVRGDESAGLAVLAGSVVAVVAEIWSDEHKVGRGFLMCEVQRKLGEIDDVLAAIGRIDDGVEIDEGIVARSILIAERDGSGWGFGGLRQIGSVESRMAASR